MPDNILKDLSNKANIELVSRNSINLTQEEFDKFAKIAIEAYSDEWYSNSVLLEISAKYGLYYESTF